MTLSQIIRSTPVEAPTPDKRRGGLLDVATVREGMTWMDPNDMFVSWNCLQVRATEVCGTDETPAKTFDGPVLVDGTDFVVYLGGACKPLGPDTKANIDRVFDLRESKGVEKAFETAVLLLGTPVAILVTGNTGPLAALASMEQALAESYAGLGTIHMSVALASSMSNYDALEERNGQLYTRLGTKVVVGAGYSPKSMYGTGDVTLYRSERVLIDAPDMANNTMNILAERAYIAVADCVVLKIADATIQAEPTSGSGADLETGTDEIVGPATWTAPTSGTLRNVSVVVTNGSVLIDGDAVTAPNTMNFDADTGETLDPPTVEATDPGDRAVVSWVVAP